MTMENNTKTTKQDDFKVQWRRSQHWQKEAEKSVPDDETILQWVEKAQQSPAKPASKVVTIPTTRRKRWMPYAAAACIAIGVTVVGLTYQGQSEGKETNTGNHTVRFLCNNGCSAQDIRLLANEVIK